MTNLDSRLKSRDITLSTKAHLVKAMVFPVVMCGYESWTVKKAEHQKLMLLNGGIGEDSSQSILKKISPGYSPEGLMAEAETPILWPPHAKS